MGSLQTHLLIQAHHAQMVLRAEIREGMNEIVKTEKAKHYSATYICRCPECGCEIWFNEDDCYDKDLINGDYQTCVICPKCKNEIEI